MKVLNELEVLDKKYKDVNENLEWKLLLHLLIILLDDLKYKKI